MPEPLSLTRDVFLTLASIAWADGELGAGEAEVLAKAARASGLSEADLASVDAALRAKGGPPSARAKVKAALTPTEAAFVYAVACLVSAADGQVDEAEREAISALADRLKIPFDVRTRAALTSAEVGRSLGVSAEAIAAIERELARVG